MTGTGDNTPAFFGKPFNRSMAYASASTGQNKGFFIVILFCHNVTFCIAHCMAYCIVYLDHVKNSINVFNMWQVRKLVTITII